MKLLHLNGKYATDGREYAMVDDNLYEDLSKYAWSVLKTGSPSRPRYSARARVNGKIAELHRYIMGFPNSIVDHRNHNTLDNRRCNLRLATSVESSRNRRSRIGSSSNYLGVSWHKPTSTWQARIYYDGKSHSLGHFSIEIDAAIAYNDAAILHYGEFAHLNPLPFGIARYEGEICPLTN